MKTCNRFLKMKSISRNFLKSKQYHNEIKKTIPVADENAVDERVHELVKNWTVVEVLGLCSNELTNFDAVFS